MRKQVVLAPKQRPPGPGVQVVVRLQPDPLRALDKWAAKQSDQPTRAEAIRRLVELGLKSPTKAPKKGRPDQTMKDSDGRIILPAGGLKAKGK
jgi:hypothetical protein